MRKNKVYPCKPQFYYIKVGFKGEKLYWVCFRDVFVLCGALGLLDGWLFRALSVCFLIVVFGGSCLIV